MSQVVVSVRCRVLVHLQLSFAQLAGSKFIGPEIDEACDSDEGKAGVFKPGSSPHVDLVLTRFHSTAPVDPIGEVKIHVVVVPAIPIRR